MFNSTSLVYVVVDVMSGVAVGAACFESDEAAEAHAARLRTQRDANDDDVQVFECAVGAEPTDG